jgi:Ca2+-binding EF-hand superfamily protein
LDKNNDGFIDKADLRMVFDSFGNVVTDEEIEKMVQILNFDVNLLKTKEI